MSGGLLEKAKQASGDDDDDADVDAAADAVIETEWTGAEASDSSVMFYIASGSLLICMGLLYFMYLLPVYSGVIIFLMLIGSAYAASLHVRSSQNNGDALNGIQWASIAVVYLLLAGVPYVAAMDFGGSVLLNYDSEEWINEDSDTITLDLRQSSGLMGSEFSGGDVTVTVSQDGAETWSGTVNVVMNAEFDGNVGSVTLAIADFYSMNAQRIKSVSGSGSPVMEDHPYTACVDVEGATDCTDLPTAELTRTVTDVDEKATGHSSDEDCSGGHESCIDYVELQGWVGEGTSDTDVLTVPARIQGTYQIDMEFVYSDGTKTIDYATITVDNNVGSWNDDTCGPGTMNIGITYTEFFFQCEDDNEFESDTALSEGYGCYTLTVTSSQGGVEMASSSSHYEFEEKTDTADGTTYTWEELNPVNSC